MNIEPKSHIHMEKILPLFLAAAALLAQAAVGQNATTTPVGAMTLTIAAGTGTGRMLTSLSVPLDEPSTAAGQTVGRITLGWTPFSNQQELKISYGMRV